MLTSPRLCSVRPLVVGKLLVTRIADGQFLPQLMWAEAAAVLGLGRCNGIERSFLRVRESVLDPINLPSSETQLASRSEDHPSHQDFAQIYRELALSRAQMRQLSIALRSQESRDQ